jgi:preprotein translocase subunit SecE
MANDDVKDDRNNDRPSDEGTSAVEVRSETADAASEQVEFSGGAFANLGTEKYVTSAFFAGAVLLAFLIGQVLATIWNALAEWPAAVRAIPQLVAYSEDDRPGLTIVVGALIAIAIVVSLYRKPNGTIVVLVASLFATIYVGVLDRIWGFITNLVYGA